MYFNILFTFNGCNDKINLVRIWMMNFSHDSMTCVQALFVLNCDVYHMWGRKCSLFSGTHDFTPFGSSWFHPFIHCRICLMTMFTG